MDGMGCCISEGISRCIRPSTGCHMTYGCCICGPGNAPFCTTGADIVACTPGAESSAGLALGKFCTTAELTLGETKRDVYASLVTREKEGVTPRDSKRDADFRYSTQLLLTQAIPSLQYKIQNIEKYEGEDIQTPFQ